MVIIMLVGLKEVLKYGVGYIKVDYNIDGGLGTEVDADSFGDGLLAHNRAYMDFIDEVTAKYPDLILENCSSGGMRMEYMSLAHSHIQSTSDQEKRIYFGGFGDGCYPRAVGGLVISR